MKIGQLDLAFWWDSLEMTFNSIWFFLFAAAVCLLYFTARPKRRWMVLLGASALFCLVGGWQTLVIATMAAAVAYLGGLLVGSERDEDRRRRRAHVTAIASVLLGVLAFIKLDVYFSWSALYFVFPIGISYYTFSIVGYLMDVYWGKEKPERHFGHFLLFVLFFPKILQGPIAKYRDLAPQLVEGHAFSFERMCLGMQLVLWGYFKKMVIADRIALFTGTALGQIDSLGGGMLFVTFCLAALQLYCDFSGCMEIARGISQILGIDLPLNFNHPFFSRSAPEFWRRWHMTLSGWFKDYVYMPLAVSPNLMKLAKRVQTRFGRSAGKAVTVVITLTVVWLLTGLWHGTGLNYIVWGLYWGLLMIISTLGAKAFRRMDEALRINVKSPFWRVFQMVRTFLIFAFGRAITMPNDLLVTADIVRKVFVDFRPWELVDGTLFTLGLNDLEFLILGIALVMVLIVSLIEERGGSARESIAKWNLVARCSFWGIAFLVIMIFGIYGPAYDAANFVYMNF